MSEQMTTGAREAIRIADKYLAGASIEQRKNLALEIVAAIGMCEREVADAVLSVSKAVMGRDSA